jgi:hypothetical protein
LGQQRGVGSFEAVVVKLGFAEVDEDLEEAMDLNLRKLWMLEENFVLGTRHLS